MSYIAKGSTHDVMHGEQCMAWQCTAPEIPKRSYTHAVQGRPALPGLLIQPQATNTHDVMHGEQWPATTAAENLLEHTSSQITILGNDCYKVHFVVAT
jgi:hypothetical protein